MSAVSTAAVLLAAGGGSRYQGDAHKLIAPFRGKPLAAWAIEAATEAGLDELIVVTGAVDLSHLLDDSVHQAYNPRWHEGLATSLTRGIEAALEGEHEAVVVGLADQPFVPAAAWRAVAECTAPIGVATYDGQRRNPVRIHCHAWSLLPTTGDRGAQALVESRADLVSEVPCSGHAVDIDTLEDLAQWS